jgi:hypothetical protein
VEVHIHFDFLRRFIFHANQGAFHKFWEIDADAGGIALDLFTCSSSESIKLRSSRLAPSAMNWSPMTLLPTPEIPATTVVLPTK